jgi:hypothetical protein
VFFTEGPVDPRRHFVVNRDAWHEQLAKKLCDDGSYVLLHAHRQGGKTSAIRGVRRAIRKKRKGQGYIVLSVSLQGADVSSRAAAWRSLAEAVRDSLPSMRREVPHGTIPALMARSGELPFTDAGSFKHNFVQENWGEHRVILVLDEFDALLAAPAEVRDDVLGALRAIRTTNSDADGNEHGRYALHALLAIGVYRIVNLSAGATSVASPFNVASASTPPDPTPDEVRAMFRAYDDECGVHTAAEVVDDIIWRAGGHVGLLSLMGQELASLHQQLAKDAVADAARVTLTRWRRWLCRTDVVERLTMSSTVQAVMRAVQFPRAGPAVVQWVRHVVLTMLTGEDAHGVALRSGGDPALIQALELVLSDGVVVQVADGYRFASPLLRLLLYTTMGAVYDWGIPAGLDVACLADGSMDMAATLLELLPHFSASHLFHAVQSKKSGSPREYAYQFQLFALLDARLKGRPWKVLAETASVNASGPLRRLDIYVEHKGRACGFELVADGADLASHVSDQAPVYLQQQQLERVLVVNFTTKQADVRSAPPDLPAGVELMHVLVDVAASSMTPYTLHSGAFAAGSPVKMRDAGLAGRDATGADAIAGTNALAVQMAAAHIATPPATPARGAAATASPAGAVGAARVRLCLDVGGGSLVEWRAAGDTTVEAAVARCAKRLPMEPGDTSRTALVRRVGAAFRVQDLEMTLEDLMGERDLFVRHGGQDYSLSVE